MVLNQDLSNYHPFLYLSSADMYVYHYGDYCYLVPSDGPMARFHIPSQTWILPQWNRPFVINSWTLFGVSNPDRILQFRDKEYLDTYDIKEDKWTTSDGVAPPPRASSPELCAIAFENQIVCPLLMVWFT
jgi:hypothetical protein